MTTQPTYRTAFRKAARVVLDERPVFKLAEYKERKVMEASLPIPEWARREGNRQMTLQHDSTFGFNAGWWR